MKNNTIQFKKLTQFFFVLLLSFQSFGQSNHFEMVKNMELMDQIYEHLEKYYVDEPQVGHLSKISIDAMLKELDPYTVYYHESNMEDYRMMTTGQYGGIGSLIRKIGDYIYIAEPYEGNPAEKAGFVAGDKILSIDGKNMVGKNSDDVSSSLKGPKGTTIKVEIEREGEGKKIISVTRDEIKLADVPYSGMLNDHIGYIKLNSFTQTASQEVKTAFTELKSKGMTELVFDLRGNGGGLLIEAVRIVNMFVKKDQVVVTTKGKVTDENRTYLTQEAPMDLEIPLTVLIDDGSASASEIVSGSLQDLDRAVIIGQTSYGKGLVQRTYDLKYGSKMKLTIAKYKIFKTTNGRDVIDGRGIEPDLKIEQKDFSRLTSMVYGNNLVFNYATKYHSTHSKIAPAGEFKLTDEEFNDFKNFVIKDTFTYSTASEERLEKMKEIAIKEGYFEDSKSEYEALLKKVTPSKERDLDKFKEEIKMLLENEIISRYYYQKGRAIDAFRNDLFVNKAKEILENKKEYNTILKK